MGLIDRLNDAKGVLPTLYKLAQSAKNIELEKQIVGLEKAILDLEKENTELRRKLEVRESTRPDPKGVGWFWKNEVGEDVRICPKCIQEKSTIIPLSQSGDRGGWFCTDRECKWSIRVRPAEPMFVQARPDARSGKQRLY